VKIQSFGRELKTLRRLSGLNLDELSSRSGIAKDYLKRMESDEVLPNASARRKLSQALGVKVPARRSQIKEV
jgi:transcriptional regulator with XRE-family HTH domain